MKTSFTANASDRQQRKSKLFLHVGPPKTGTSFLQGTITKSAYVTLLQDDIQYLGVCLDKARRQVDPNTTADTGDPSRGRHFYSYKEIPNLTPDQLYATCPREFISLFESDSSSLPKLHPYLQQIVRLALASSSSQSGSPRHAVMANEFLSEIRHESQRDLLWQFLSKYYDVHVLLTYRRLHEWLPSYFYQKSRNRARFEILWPGQTYQRKATRRTRSILDTGSDGLMFDLYNQTQRSVRFHDDLWLYSQIMDSLENCSTTQITVLNFHQKTDGAEIDSRAGPVGHPTPDPWMVEFFCSGKVFPAADIHYTCKAARSDPDFANHNTANERPDVNLDLVATAAFRAGLLSRPSSLRFPSLTRREVKRKISAFNYRLKLARTKSVKNSNTTTSPSIIPNDTGSLPRQESHRPSLLSEFPIRCLPNSTLDGLFDYSWHAERQYYTLQSFDIGSSNRWDEALPAADYHSFRQTFDEYNNRLKFCWIDAQSVVRDPTWRQFFQQLT
jgi:hypothetical protein